MIERTESHPPFDENAMLRDSWCLEEQGAILVYKREPVQGEDPSNIPVEIVSGTEILAAEIHSMQLKADRVTQRVTQRGPHHIGPAGLRRIARIKRSAMMFESFRLPLSPGAQAVIRERDLRIRNNVNSQLRSKVL